MSAVAPGVGDDVLSAAAAEAVWFDANCLCMKDNVTRQQRTVIVYVRYEIRVKDVLFGRKETPHRRRAARKGAGVMKHTSMYKS